MKQIIAMFVVYVMVFPALAAAQGIDACPTPQRSDSVWYNTCGDPNTQDPNCFTEYPLLGVTFPAYSFIPWTGGAMCCPQDQTIGQLGITGAVGNAFNIWSNDNYGNNVSFVEFYSGGATTDTQVTVYGHTYANASDPSMIGQTFSYYQGNPTSGWYATGAGVQFWLGSPYVNRGDPSFLPFIE